MTYVLQTIVSMPAWINKSATLCIQGKYKSCLRGQTLIEIAYHGWKDFSKNNGASTLHLIIDDSISLLMRKKSAHN